MARPEIDRHEALDISTEIAAKYFRALGDPTRLRIVEALMEGPLSVTELTHYLRIAQSNVSNHIACLRWCGLVGSERRGKWTYYVVRDPKVRKIVGLVRTLVSAHAERIAACTRVDG